MVKCRTCGKSLEKSEAILIQSGKKNTYYCFEHGEQLKYRKQFFELLSGLNEFPSNLKAFDRYFKPLADEYGWDRLCDYFRNKEEYLISLCKTKNFNGFFPFCSYVSKVFSQIENSPATGPKTAKFNDVDIKEVVTDMKVQFYNRKKTRHGLKAESGVLD